jgi:hypothetical protein
MGMTEKQLFVAKVTELLVGLGAEQQQGDEFILETRVGRLRLRAIVSKGDGLGTVWGRFDDLQAARESVPCSPFNGEWFHHYFGGWTVERALSHFLSNLQMVLP